MKLILKWTILVGSAALVGLLLVGGYATLMQRLALRAPSGGMMGLWVSPQQSGAPLTIDGAVGAVQRYLTSLSNPDLQVAEVMEFTNNFYAEIEEESTRIHAFELLIDKYTGAVYPEPGPNMMWNTKYGMMGRFSRRAVSEEMPISEGQAREHAQAFLDANLPSTVADEEAEAFYGYYTIHVLKDGQIYGMLSVNGYTGQVWYHNWHGAFVGIKGMG